MFFSVNRKSFIPNIRRRQDIPDFIHGLRTPIKAFFPLKYPRFLGLGRQIGEMNFGTFGVFSAELKVS